MGLVDAQTTAAFLDEVVALNNDELTADLFGALDNTGNLAAAPALIKGLQSDKVELRVRALDALSEMQSDATVVQWLQYAARNDAHDRVRAEAVRVLAQAGNQP
jgi:HEAT repeat protein